jgi:hypothetical protein
MHLKERLLIVGFCKISAGRALMVSQTEPAPTRLVALGRSLYSDTRSIQMGAMMVSWDWQNAQ